MALLLYLLEGSWAVVSRVRSTLNRGDKYRYHNNIRASDYS